MQPKKTLSGSLFPDAIRKIAVVAPAGPPDALKLAAGIDALKREGVAIVSMPGGGTRSGASYLAGTLTERLAELNAAIRNPEVDLILCARGGFGAGLLLPDIDWETLRARKLPLVGYSDITALHAGMLAMNAGLPVAAPMALKMPDIAKDAFSRTMFRLALAPQSIAEIPAPPEMPVRVPNAFAGDAVTGKPFAANLTVLCALCGTPYFPDFTGRILILEDVNEPIYKIDRMLAQLAMNGVFGKVAALAFGSFTGVLYGAELAAVFERTAKLVNGPVWRNFCFGHALPMTAVNAAQTWSMHRGAIASIQ